MLTACHTASHRISGLQLLKGKLWELPETINMFLIFSHFKTPASLLPSKESPENPSPSLCNRTWKKSTEL